MTVREMHIELEQSLQQVGAHRTRKYLPEEKDWVLTKMQDRFIQSRLKSRTDGSGGYDIDQTLIDSIRPLIVSGMELTPYIDERKSRYKCFLPCDYAYLLSDWSFTRPLCEGTSSPFVNKDLYIQGIRQDYSAKTTAPYYQTLSIQLNSTSINIPGDLPYGHSYSGYRKKEDISFLIPWLIKKGQYWWERLGDYNQPGYYLTASTTWPGLPQLQIDDILFTNWITETLALMVTPADGILRENRLVSPSQVPILNTTEYYRSSYYSPISELSGNLLYIYNDNSFTVSKVGISYIRRPAPISLNLGCGSELPTEFHQLICDLAVEYLKGRLENPSGRQLIENDNSIRTIL